MTDDTRALLDQTGDFRRRGMDGAVASNERVLAGRVPALLDRIEALTAEVTERDKRIQFFVDAEKAATKRADELADQATSQADRIEALERSVEFYRNAADQQDMAVAAKQERIAAMEKHIAVLRAEVHRLRRKDQPPVYGSALGADR